MPSATGVSLSVKEFLRKAKTIIPNLVGVKFTSNSFMEMAECINLEEHRFEVLNGYDENLICALALGVEGGVGSTYNYIPSIYNHLIEAFKQGDLEKARIYNEIHRYCKYHYSSWRRDKRWKGYYASTWNRLWKL